MFFWSELCSHSWRIRYSSGRFSEQKLQALPSTFQFACQKTQVNTEFFKNGSRILTRKTAEVILWLKSAAPKIWLQKWAVQNSNLKELQNSDHNSSRLHLNPSLFISNCTLELEFCMQCIKLNFWRNIPLNCKILMPGVGAHYSIQTKKWILLMRTPSF